MACPNLPAERELLASRMNLTLGSSTAIVAHNLASLGCRVGFISRIGDDALGRLQSNVRRWWGHVSKVRRVAGETKTGLTVILQRELERNILTYPGTIFDLTLEDLDFEYLTDAGHFHLSSYYLQRGLRPQVGELFRKLKAEGLTISLDTNDDPEDRWEGGLMDVLRYVDVFLPNAREACRITGSNHLETAVTRLAEQTPLVVIKRGNRARWRSVAGSGSTVRR